MIGNDMVRPTQVTLLQNNPLICIPCCEKVLELAYLNYMNPKAEVTNVGLFWPQPLKF